MPSSWEKRKGAPTADSIEHLRRPQTIRERAQAIYDSTPGHFDVRLDRLPEVVEQVESVTRKNYPSGDVPIHGRFRHFGDRLQELEPKLSQLGREDQARTLIDLVVVSVLLDAGAGPDWRYQEAATGQTLSRSEGLAVASFRMFEAGLFSEGRAPEVTADGLRAIDDSALADAFQVSASNPLVGVDGRAKLMRDLGAALEAYPEYFGTPARPGNLIDHVEPNAVAILSAVLDGLSSIWPSRLTLDGVNLGDVWRHPAAGLVPFHKLSQWLTYSLVEPFAVAGTPVDGVDQLTGLAEYRNGGLFVDTGVLEPKHADVTRKAHTADSEIIVEWRALTIVLLDHVAEALGRPLAEVLEGGTWQAGRIAAREKRNDGSPPIQVLSDGTLF